jgi:putative SOS response-associated peptidase YedK
MALAGLYNPWRDPKTNTELFTFTIITTSPNPVVGVYHDREPVQLPRELEHSWLNPDFTEPEQIMPMLKTSSPDQMASWHVGDEAKNPRNDYPEIINPV